MPHPLLKNLCLTSTTELSLADGNLVQCLDVFPALKGDAAVDYLGICRALKAESGRQEQFRRQASRPDVVHEKEHTMIVFRIAAAIVLVLEIAELSAPIQI